MAKKEVKATAEGATIKATASKVAARSRAETAGKKPVFLKKVTSPRSACASKTPVKSRDNTTREAPKVSRNPRLIADRVDEQSQLDTFKKGMAMFQAKKYGLAKRILQKVQVGPNVELVHRSGVYQQICMQHLKRGKQVMETADDYYNEAVQLLNNLQLEKAEKLLKKGLSIDPGADYLHYARALVHCLAGNYHDAYEPLKIAIEIDPQNRILALRDPDLRSLHDMKVFNKLLKSTDEAFNTKESEQID